jgi:hypothetical protein
VSEPTTTLSVQQQQAIVALLAGKRHVEAAEAAGVSVSTLRRWHGEPDFIEAYRAMRRDAFEAAIARLQTAASQAVDTLIGSLAAKRHTDRIKAAQVILIQANRGVETVDLAERLAKLEAQRVRTRSARPA